MKNKLINLYRKVKLFFIRQRNKQKSTSQVFTDIYLNNLWGGKSGEFFSGSGSRGKYANIYCTQIKTFLASHSLENIKLIDLGCGDFEIGKQLVNDNIDYIGVDIVSPLIEYNNKKYLTNNVTFVCLNIITDDLPEGDVCLIRTVFQHLSNDEILKILPKLSKYKFCLITEHYPEKDNCIPNKDKPHGGDIRLYDNSAVYLDKPPFNVKNIQQLFTIHHEMGGELRTLLIEN
jgi:2-polyprenyl-3-methyl-5-hydroxy-6-metoxy-1,4-benzoquinol methylase